MIAWRTSADFHSLRRTAHRMTIRIMVTSGQASVESECIQLKADASSPNKSRDRRFANIDCVVKQPVDLGYDGIATVFEVDDAYVVEAAGLAEMGCAGD